MGLFGAIKGAFGKPMNAGAAAAKAGVSPFAPKGLAPSAPPIQSAPSTDMPVSPMPSVPEGNQPRWTGGTPNFNESPGGGQGVIMMQPQGGIWDMLKQRIQTDPSGYNTQANIPVPFGFQNDQQRQQWNQRNDAAGAGGGIMTQRKGPFPMPAGMTGGNPNAMRTMQQPQMRPQVRMNPMNQQRMGLGPRMNPMVQR